MKRSCAKRKRTNSSFVSGDYYSDDSAVESDMDVFTDDDDFSPSTTRPKKTKFSRGTKSVKEEVGMDTAGISDSKTGMCGSNGSGSNVVSKEGQRILMRQWLEQQADSEQIPGFHWYNKEKREIRIPVEARLQVWMDHRWLPCLLCMGWTHRWEYRIQIYTKMIKSHLDISIFGSLSCVQFSCCTTSMNFVQDVNCPSSMFFTHFCNKPYVAREPQSDHRLYEHHGLWYIRHHTRTRLCNRFHHKFAVIPSCNSDG